MDELLTDEQLKEARQRRDALLHELRSRGDLPKDESDEEFKKSNRTWQGY